MQENPSGGNRHEMMIRILDQSAKQEIKTLFIDLEAKLKIAGIADVLITAVFELVENAVKANLKRAFFERRGFNLIRAEEYQAGLIAFKESYPELHRADYVTALRELELSVMVNVDHDHQRLLVFVENNTIPVAQEEARIRGQLAAAMNATAFADFCVQCGDSEEGGGLGLGMIVFLIRNLGFLPEYFRVYFQNQRTVARLEFPLQKDYRPLRQKWHEKSNLPK
jgi:hypothetical protein